MRFMVRSSIVFFVLLFTVARAHAHVDVGGPHWVERMKMALHLDDAQAKAIRNINQEAQAERRALREKIAKRIDAILTEDQRRKLDAIRKKQMACSENSKHCRVAESMSVDDARQSD